METLRFRTRADLVRLSAERPGALAYHFLLAVRQALNAEPAKSSKDLGRMDVMRWSRDATGLKEVRDQRDIQTLMLIQQKLNDDQVEPAADVIAQRLTCGQGCEGQLGKVGHDPALGVGVRRCPAVRDRPQWARARLTERCGSGEGVGRLLGHDARLNALVPAWVRWLLSAESLQGRVLRRCLGVPLADRPRGLADGALFPLPLPEAERAPWSGRSRVRWHRRDEERQWLSVIVAVLNVLYGFYEGTLFKASAPQEWCLRRLHGDLQGFLREARLARLGGEPALIQYINGHLDPCDRFGYVQQLVERACLPNAAGTCDARALLEGTALGQVAAGPEPFLREEKEMPRPMKRRSLRLAGGTRRW